MNKKPIREKKHRLWPELYIIERIISFTGNTKRRIAVFHDYEVFEARICKELVGYFVIGTRKEHVEVVDFFCLREEAVQRSVFYNMLNLIKKYKKCWLCFRICDEYIEKLLAEEQFTVESSSPFFVRDLNLSGSDFENTLAQPRDWYLTENCFHLE